MFSEPWGRWDGRPIGPSEVDPMEWFQDVNRWTRDVRRTKCLALRTCETVLALLDGKVHVFVALSYG